LFSPETQPKSLVKNSWVVAQAYSSNSSWQWDTKGLQPRQYILEVWARSRGSMAKVEAFARPHYTLEAEISTATDNTNSAL
jgi:hypothetical protein